jgi:hypothetical protein
MDAKKMENQMKQDLQDVFTKILDSFHYILDISAKSRSGAEISDYLEDAFVEYFEKHEHERISDAESAPKGQTKNPYDIKFNYTYTDTDTGEEFDDVIWGDIKATKASYDDSNPDLGTPTKMIKFMLDGHFYMVFVFFEYEATDDNKTRFIPYDDGNYARIMFLKDIHHSVRINPKPQFQVNIHTEDEYRTKMEFIDLFEQKYKESIDRIIKKQNKKKDELEALFDKVRKVQKDK